MNQAAASDPFFSGNGKFLTRKLWGIANQHTFGQMVFTRPCGKLCWRIPAKPWPRASPSRTCEYDRDSIIEF